MQFRQYWPLYLQAHRLPGTRAMHYVATGVGIMAAIEAVMTWDLRILIAGIILSYGIAISGHWFIEHNQPLIRINPVWGALADFRMVWLAMCGRLQEELRRHGAADAHDLGRTEASSNDKNQAADIVLRLPAVRLAIALHHPAHDAGRRAFSRGASFCRHALLLASTAGLTAVLADLHDLVEPSGKPAYPIVQLGVPIIAFAAAFILSYGATMLAARQSAGEASLRRASIAQFALGLAVFALAEFAEAISTTAIAG